MKRKVASGLYVVVFGWALLATGCFSYYYKVTDPASGRVYYTDKVDAERSGVVKLKDARSKSSVTLQNSEVLKISEAEYKAGLAAPAPAEAATPAPAPAESTAPK